MKINTNAIGRVLEVLIINHSIFTIFYSFLYITTIIMMDDHNTVFRYFNAATMLSYGVSLTSWPIKIFFILNTYINSFFFLSFAWTLIPIAKLMQKGSFLKSQPIERILTLKKISLINIGYSLIIDILLYKKGDFLAYMSVKFITYFIMSLFIAAIYNAIISKVEKRKTDSIKHQEIG